MIPKSHPRYASLMARHTIEDGVKVGITTPTGLVAQGRGEAFDYLIGERTHSFAERACTAAAALLLLAEHSVISINGNTAVLVPDEMIELSKVCGAKLEVNLFYDNPKRRSLIEKHFRKKNVSILGARPDAKVPGLASARANVSKDGIYLADVVLVSLEDGDRTAALKENGKKVIAIDLNPMSRTPRFADIAIVDNVQRALPLISKEVKRLRKLPEAELRRIVSRFDNQRALAEAERCIRTGNKKPRKRAASKRSSRTARSKKSKTPANKSRRPSS